MVIAGGCGSARKRIMRHIGKRPRYVEHVVEEENAVDEESEQEAEQSGEEARNTASEGENDDALATDEMATAALFNDDDDDADDEEDADADDEAEPSGVEANTGDGRDKAGDEDDSDDDDDEVFDIDNISGASASEGSIDSEEDSVDSDESDELSDGFGEDCIGDSDDREYLNSLTMLERETILSERYEARRRREENRKLKEEIRREKAPAKGAEITRGGRRKRQTAIKAERKNAEVISAARAEQERRKQEGWQKQRERQLQEAAAAKAAEKLSSSDALSERDDESALDSMSEQEVDYDGEDSSKYDSDDEDATLEDLQKLRIKRAWLAKNYDEPFFAKAVTRRFVRYTLGVVNNKPVYRICEVEGVEKSKNSYPFERIKDANKQLRVSFPDYRAKKPVRAVKMTRISNHPFTENEYKFWRSTQQQSLSLAQEDNASDVTLKPFRQWTKRRVNDRLTGFAKAINHVYKDDAVLDKLIDQRIKKRRFAHNSAYKILNLVNTIAAAEHEIADLQQAHEQDLWSRFQSDLQFEDRNIEKTDRDWGAERTKWNKLSLEGKRRKHFIPQQVVDMHIEKIEEKKKSIAQMQKQLSATKAQKLKEERESKKLSKEESGINGYTKHKLHLMRRLRQRRYRTNARKIKQEEANNRFRRYETRPTMLWATKKTVKKDKDGDKAASAAAPAKDTHSKLGLSANSRKHGRKRKLKSPRELKKKKRKKKKHKKSTKKKMSLSGGMSLNEWRMKSQMRHHGTIQP